ncbi:exonuclease/endonuclease/phosphatase family protein [Taibaiella koreensis]|uniref:hypothetical protein n=1 Tax=Taibaiella koreensis TaxID=1268548 RepID=UPI000E59C8ED|nr:hypothetical protein [Taibaiella koreensis]
MSIKPIKLPLFLLMLSGQAFTPARGQDTDTLRVMQYNLLNYGDGDNPTSYKNPRLQTILDFVKPDIFGANEITRGAEYSEEILNTVLGAEWEKGSYANANNQIQTNMLFWKKSKLGLLHQQTIASQTRDIIAFRLYYKDAMLAQTRDTTFLTVIVAHLKAGSYSQDSLDRIRETALVATYLNTYPGNPGNYLFMGDMNVYTSEEGCYQNLVNSSNPKSKFYDPIDRPGNWNGNSSFADIHSQSTRRVALADGGATGGLDDRFDQILISGPIKNNEQRISYQPMSYRIIGQDGNHFNRGLLDNPANTIVPSTVLQSLYNMSDHLPVTARFVVRKVTQGAGISGPQAGDPGIFNVENPLEGNLLRLHCSDVAKVDGAVKVTLHSLSGAALYSASWEARRQSDFRVTIPGLIPGLYLLQLKGREGNGLLHKLVLVH